jgi:hypothetical protein
MLSILAICIYLLTSLLMLVVHWTRPKFGSQWLLAVVGAIIAWAMVFLARLGMPQRVALFTWQPEALFPVSPSLLVDSTSWLFALGIATLVLSLTLTAVARIGTSNLASSSVSPDSGSPITSVDDSQPPFADWRAWAGSLILSGFGLVSVLSGNLITLLLSWAALDIVEVIILLSQLKQSVDREKIMIAFSARLAGITMLLLGGIVIWSEGGLLTLAAVSPRAGPYLLLAAGLRLGVLPLHLPFAQELLLRRGLGTALRLIPAAASLILLARSATVGVEGPLLIYLLTFSALAALVGSIAWLVARDELIGRPSWILGMASLAVAGALRTQPQVCLAWGIAGIFSGSLIFMTSIRRRSLLPLALLGALGISALPFTPAWYGALLYQSSAAEKLVISPSISALLSGSFLLAQAFLLAGYIRHSLRNVLNSAEIKGLGVERWVWIIYPVGLTLLPLIHIIIGWWFWPDTDHLPWIGWFGGLIACGVATGVWYLSQRVIRPQADASIPRITSFLGPVFSLNWLYRMVWVFYRISARLTALGSTILEGEGGILWTLVLLALIYVLLKK